MKERKKNQVVFIGDGGEKFNGFHSQGANRKLRVNEISWTLETRVLPALSGGDPLPPRQVRLDMTLTNDPI